VLQQLRDNRKPVIVVINKIDLSDQEKVEAAIEEWKTKLVNADIIAISALHCFHTALVFDTILKHLPESPEYFPKEELTDRSQRFFVSEIIREKILLNFSQEEKLTRISVYLFVARESQKAIILGHQGKAIKKLGTEARKDIEAFLEKHIFLELNVKVRKDWRDDVKELKRFGYSLDND
jgi:GTP-binding protein Era